MADIFLSYASSDRASAARVQRALAQAGYVVFWDQEIPPGADWDTWIRGKLTAARVVVVLWSKRSIASSNVRHEAMIARDANKLLPVLIETLAPSDFPMGLYMVQALNLTNWNGDARADVAQRLLAELNARNASPQPLGQGSTPAPPPNNAVAITIGITVAVALIALAVFGQRPDAASHDTADAAAWAQLDKTDPAALRSFQAGAEGDFRDQAEQVLAQLEESHFALAQEADSIEAFEAFLTDFPGSSHTNAARGRIVELRQVAVAPSTPASVNTTDAQYLMGYHFILTGQSPYLSCGTATSAGALHLHFGPDGNATYSAIPYIGGIPTDVQPLTWELRNKRYRLSIDGVSYESSFNVETGTGIISHRVGRYSGVRSGYFLLCPGALGAGFAAAAPELH